MPPRFCAAHGWPQVTITSFSRVLDYDNGAMREDVARTRAEPTGGPDAQASR